MSQCQKPYSKVSGYSASSPSYSKLDGYATPIEGKYSTGDLVYECFSVVMALLVSDYGLLLLDDNMSYIQL